MPMDEVIQNLESCTHPLQVVAVAGHNQDLRARLDRLKGKLTLTLHTFGWSDRIPELMAAADVLITKPGGVTASEALAAGLPMVLVHPIPGPEEKHARFLEQLGVGLRAYRGAEIAGIITALLKNPGNLQKMAQRSREIARPDAAHSIAQVSRALLEKESYIELLASPPARSGESAYLM